MIVMFFNDCCRLNIQSRLEPVSLAAAAPKQGRTKVVASPLFLRFRTDNERRENGQARKTKTNKIIEKF